LSVEFKSIGLFEKKNIFVINEEKNEKTTRETKILGAKSIRGAGP